MRIEGLRRPAYAMAGPIPRNPAPAAVLTRRTPVDIFFQTLVVFTIWLEIVVFIEPAPVDVAIVLCLFLGVLMGKLIFSEIDRAALVAVTIFIVANLTSLYDPLDPYRAIAYVLITIYLVGSWLFFTGLFGRYGQAFMATMIRAYCFAGLISAFLGVSGYFRLLPYYDLLTLNYRARGLFKDPNVYGPYFVPMALFSLLRVTDARLRWHAKIEPTVYCVGAALAMLLCFSRACWINCGIALGVFLTGQWLCFRSRDGAGSARKKFLVAGTVLILSGVAVAMVLDAPGVRHIFDVRLGESGLQGYDSARFATQRLALDAAVEHPLGIGPGQAEQVFGYATHSSYLRILSENGIVALLALLAFNGLTMARALRVLKRGEDQWLREVNLVAFACIAGHLINSAVVDTVHWRHIWFIYALPWAPARLRDYSRYLPGRRIVERRSSAFAV